VAGRLDALQRQIDELAATPAATSDSARPRMRRGSTLLRPRGQAAAEAPAERIPRTESSAGTELRQDQLEMRLDDVEEASQTEVRQLRNRVITLQHQVEMQNQSLVALTAAIERLRGTPTPSGRADVERRFGHPPERG
jgi:hypothetical protein